MPAIDPLADWIRYAWYLKHLRASKRRYERIDAHWNSFSRDWVRQSRNREALLGVEPICQQLKLKPHRGHRGGTKWEAVYVDIRNRLTQLEREADRESMGTGHNSNHYQEDAR
jgi:hypothetical protein